MQFIKSSGERTVIVLSGRLDHASAGPLMEELKTLEGTGVKRIDFECAELEYMSSAGIRAMVFVKQKIDRTAHVDVHLHDAPQQVKDVFVMSGLADYFEFETS